jgi:ferric-dicitrate binding protein FerR (iron transport regulator)
MNECELERSHDDAALELLRLAGPRPEAPPERRARVEGAVRAHWQSRLAGQRRRQLLWGAALAAAAALVVAVVVPPIVTAPGIDTIATVETISGEVRARTREGSVRLAPATAIARGSTIDTGVAGRAALRLASGVSLRLDHDTSIELSQGRRLRLDRGTAYVDVDPVRASGGLVVATAIGEVRDIGTQFEVRVAGDEMRVRVREGRVLVERGEILDEIRAGHEGSMVGRGRLELQPLTAFDPGWSWLLEVAPAFPIEERSVADYLRWLSRETGLGLRWEDPDLRTSAEEIILHGDISGVRPDQTPGMVLPTCGLEQRRDGDSLVVGRSAR